jgi:hypothetical protein
MHEKAAAARSPTQPMQFSCTPSYHSLIPRTGHPNKAPPIIRPQAPATKPIHGLPDLQVPLGQLHGLQPRTALPLAGFEVVLARDITLALETKPMCISRLHPRLEQDHQVEEGNMLLVVGLVLRALQAGLGRVADLRKWFLENGRNEFEIMF